MSLKEHSNSLRKSSLKELSGKLRNSCLVAISKTNFPELKAKLHRIGQEISEYIQSSSYETDDTYTSHESVVLYPILSLCSALRVQPEGSHRDVWMYARPLEYFSTLFQQDQILDLAETFCTSLKASAVRDESLWIENVFMPELNKCRAIHKILLEIVSTAETLVRAIGSKKPDVIEQSLLSLVETKKNLLPDLTVPSQLPCFDHFQSMSKDFLLLLWNVLVSKLLQKTFDHPENELHNTDILRTSVSSLRPNNRYDWHLNKLIQLMIETIPSWKESPRKLLKYDERRRHADDAATVRFNAARALATHNTTIDLAASGAEFTLKNRAKTSVDTRGKSGVKKRAKTSENRLSIFSQLKYTALTLQQAANGVLHELCEENLDADALQSQLDKAISTLPYSRPYRRENAEENDDTLEILQAASEVESAFDDMSKILQLLKANELTTDCVKQFLRNAEGYQYLQISLCESKLQKMSTRETGKRNAELFASKTVQLQELSASMHALSEKVTESLLRINAVDAFSSDSALCSCEESFRAIWADFLVHYGRFCDILDKLSSFKGVTFPDASKCQRMDEDVKNLHKKVQMEVEIFKNRLKSHKTKLVQNKISSFLSNATDQRNKKTRAELSAEIRRAVQNSVICEEYLSNIRRSNDGNMLTQMDEALKQLLASASVSRDTQEALRDVCSVADVLGNPHRARYRCLLEHLLSKSSEGNVSLSVSHSLLSHDDCSHFLSTNFQQVLKRVQELQESGKVEQNEKEQRNLTKTILPQIKSLEKRLRKAYRSDKWQEVVEKKDWPSLVKKCADEEEIEGLLSSFRQIRAEHESSRKEIFKIEKAFSELKTGTTESNSPSIVSPEIVDSLKCLRQEITKIKDSFKSFVSKFSDVEQQLSSVSAEKKRFFQETVENDRKIISMSFNGFEKSDKNLQLFSNIFRDNPRFLKAYQSDNFCHKLLAIFFQRLTNVVSALMLNEKKSPDFTNFNSSLNVLRVVLSDKTVEILLSLKKILENSCPNLSAWQGLSQTVTELDHELSQEFALDGLQSLLLSIQQHIEKEKKMLKMQQKLLNDEAEEERRLLRLESDIQGTGILFEEIKKNIENFLHSPPDRLTEEIVNGTTVHLKEQNNLALVKVTELKNRIEGCRVKIIGYNLDDKLKKIETNFIKVSSILKKFEIDSELEKKQTHFEKYCASNRLLELKGKIASAFETLLSKVLKGSGENWLLEMKLCTEIKKLLHEAFSRTGGMEVDVAPEEFDIIKNVQTYALSFQSSKRIEEMVDEKIETIRKILDKLEKFVQKNFKGFLAGEESFAIEEWIGQCEKTLTDTDAFLKHLQSVTERDYFEEFIGRSRYFLHKLFTTSQDVLSFSRGFLPQLEGTNALHDLSYSSPYATDFLSRQTALANCRNEYLRTKETDSELLFCRTSANNFLTELQENMRLSSAAVLSDISSVFHSSDDVNAIIANHYSIESFVSKIKDKNFEDEIARTKQCYDDFVKAQHTLQERYRKIDRNSAKAEKYEFEMFDRILKTARKAMEDFESNINEKWKKKQSSLLEKLKKVSEDCLQKKIDTVLSSLFDPLETGTNHKFQEQWEKFEKFARNHLSCIEELQQSMVEKCILDSLSAYFKETRELRENTPHEDRDISEFVLSLGQNLDKSSAVVALSRDSKSKANDSISAFNRIVKEIEAVADFNDFQNSVSVNECREKLHRSETRLESMTVFYKATKANQLFQPRACVRIISKLDNRLQLFNNFCEEYCQIERRCDLLNGEIMYSTLGELEAMKRRFEKLEKKNKTLEAEFNSLKSKKESLKILNDSDPDSTPFAKAVQISCNTLESFMANTKIRLHSLTRLLTERSQSCSEHAEKIANNYEKLKNCSTAIRNRDLQAEGKVLRLMESLRKNLDTEQGNSRLNNDLRNNIVDKCLKTDSVECTVYMLNQRMPKSVKSNPYDKRWNVHFTTKVKDLAVSEIARLPQFTCFYEALMPLWQRVQNGCSCGDYTYTRGISPQNFSEEFCNPENGNLRRYIFSALNDEKTIDQAAVHPMLLTMELLLYIKVASTMEHKRFALKTCRFEGSGEKSVQISDIHSAKDVIDMFQIGFQVFPNVSSRFVRGISQSRIEKGIPILQLFIKAWLAYKCVVNFNARNFQGEAFHPWGPTFILPGGCDPVVDIYDSTRFKATFADLANLRKIYHPDLVPWVLLYRLLTKGLEVSIEQILEPTPLSCIFHVEPQNEAANARLLCSYVAHCIYSNTFLTGELCAKLWKKYGVRGVDLKQHMRNTYRTMWFYSTDDAPFVPSQETFASFFPGETVNDTEEEVFVFEKKYSKFLCGGEEPPRVNFCIFDLLIFALCTGIDLAVLKKQGQKDGSCFWQEIVNSTYKPDIAAFGNRKPLKKFCSLADIDSAFLVPMNSADRAYIPLVRSMGSETISLKPRTEERIPFLLVEGEFSLAGYALLVAGAAENIYTTLRASLELDKLSETVRSDERFKNFHHPLRDEIEEKIIAYSLNPDLRLAHALIKNDQHLQSSPENVPSTRPRVQRESLQSGKKHSTPLAKSRKNKDSSKRGIAGNYRVGKSRAFKTLHSSHKKRGAAAKNNAEEHLSAQMQKLNIGKEQYTNVLGPIKPDAPLKAPGAKNNAEESLSAQMQQMKIGKQQDAAIDKGRRKPDTSLKALKQQKSDSLFLRESSDEKHDYSKRSEKSEADGIDEISQIIGKIKICAQNCHDFSLEEID